MVQDQDTIDAHPVFYLLSFHIRNVSNCHHHQIPLLFPCSRSQVLKKQRIGTLDMLYGAVDLQPRSFVQTQINTATAMVLPLQASIFVPPTSTMVAPLRTKQMLVSDVFQYESNRIFLHWKDTRDPSLLQWSRTPSTIFKGLARGLLQLQPYFVPVCRPAPLKDLEVSFAPFVNQLISTDGRSSVSAKSFRLAVLSSVTPPSTLRNVSTAHWQMFWSLSLTTLQRNVVYRFIVGCIPHRGFLHHIMPNIFDSSCCPVCLLATHSASHLLFYCPSKEQVWQGVIFEFLCPTTSISDIKQALLSLDFFDIWYCQYRGISSYRILFIALSQIWLAHMRYIFDQVPIVPTAIIVAIRSNIRQTIEEDRCNSLL
ncbi:hypothetical protein [Parasitella parasitica]|uniref:Reverse transcriptase zinc-binding domain-containing protein n=1 Tax=Parasitella parasitica TaxID=35722 RepID=A0A0B7NME4_9FUNG|nr:hypothetical protein [Parasitella parasitica]